MNNGTVMNWKNALGSLAVILCASTLLVYSIAARAQEDRVVAIINDYPIKESAIAAEIVKLPLGDQVSIRSDLDKFAESLIQEEVLFQSVLSTQFEDEDELRNEVKTLVVNHLINKYVTQKLIVPEAEVEQFYNENTSVIRGETVEVSHILTETRDECVALKERIDAGESFAELARQYSLHERTAQNDGKLGSMMDHDGPLGFERELFKIPHNKAHIFESEDGCHIMMVSDQNTPPLPPLENVYAGIENLLKRELEIEALQVLMERAHSAVTVIRP